MSDNYEKKGDGKPSAASTLAERTVTDDDVLPYEPSVTISVFVTWILPVLLIAILTRFAVDKDAMGTALGRPPSRPVQINLNSDPSARQSSLPLASSKREKKSRPNKAPTPPPTLIAGKPSSYIEVVQSIGRRRMDWEGTDTSSHPPSVTPSPTTGQQNAQTAEATYSSKKPKMSEPARGASSDPVRMKLRERIEQSRTDSQVSQAMSPSFCLCSFSGKEGIVDGVLITSSCLSTVKSPFLLHVMQADPENLLKAIELADALRIYDVQYHDGGTAQEEAIQTYKMAIELALDARRKMVEKGEETNRSLHGTIDVNGEVMLDYSARSIDGILCALYTAIGKVFFMSNMFEKAAESYTTALEIEPLYLDAMASRGSSRIILGKYEGAAKDFETVMVNDHSHRFLDVFTGLARVLQAKETAVPGGWDTMIEQLHAMIPSLEKQHANLGGNREARNFLSTTLNRLYHVLFLYHDVKTKDTDTAWGYLSKSYTHKMSVLPEWNAGFEGQKIAATKQIFHRGFWPAGVGSNTRVPIFIIGFVRSGSTLLERVLDAHPKIVGTGENSVFNGQLDEIRNKIVETSISGDANALTNVISSLADEVVVEMRQRWRMVASGEDRAADQLDPERYVDKMLTNYYNVGFIHMLFPNALILHVAREPMDTIFSAYKHEFPSGTLDYTSDFSPLAELYHGYRNLMEHWDKELPGRVTHIRYEDMVHDMPGVAKKIIEATGLDWDDSVLDFHKKKQAVNTLSTTQVRKGVYKDSLQAWKRYEKHLTPLVTLIGKRTQFDLKTTLPGYVPRRETDSDETGNSRAEDETKGQSDEPKDPSQNEL